MEIATSSLNIHPVCCPDYRRLEISVQSIVRGVHQSLGAIDTQPSKHITGSENYGIPGVVVVMKHVERGDVVR